jgi:hypothetical protein
MSPEEQKERAQVYCKCMEYAGAFVAIMQANGATEQDIAVVGSLMTSHQFRNVIDGSEDAFLQMNVNLVVSGGPEVEKHATIMSDAMKHVSAAEVLGVVLDRWAGR